jgi:hypothetical protein
LLWPAGEELFVVAGGKWTRLEQVGGGRFRGTARAGSGDALLVGRGGGSAAAYQTVLVYGTADGS